MLREAIKALDDSDSQLLFDCINSIKMVLVEIAGFLNKIMQESREDRGHMGMIKYLTHNTLVLDVLINSSLVILEASEKKNFVNGVLDYIFALTDGIPL